LILSFSAQISYCHNWRIDCNAYLNKWEITAVWRWEHENWRMLQGDVEAQLFKWETYEPNIESKVCVWGNTVKWDTFGQNVRCSKKRMNAIKQKAKCCNCLKEQKLNTQENTILAKTYAQSAPVFWCLSGFWLCGSLCLASTSGKYPISDNIPTSLLTFRITRFQKSNTCC
jgi:hypothetical protein